MGYGGGLLFYRVIQLVQLHGGLQRDAGRIRDGFHHLLIRRGFLGVLVALVGSCMRGTSTTDSDVDIVIISSHTDRYFRDNSWAANRAFRSGHLGVNLECSWLEVEYRITNECLAALPLNAGTWQVILDDICVLFERGNLLSRYLTIR